MFNLISFLIIYFQRSESPITLVDSIQGDTTYIHPHKSYFLYWFGNIYTSLGLGMLVDKNSQKRYEYKKYNYFTRRHNKLKNIRFEPINKGRIKINFGIPYVNHFHLLTDSGKIYTTGFWGISLGADYFLAENKYISSSINLATNLFVPVPAAVDIYGEYESSSTIFGNLMINKSTPFIEYGAGLSVA